MDYFCKIYVDADIDRYQLAKYISSALSGSIEKESYIDSQFSQIFVGINDNIAPDKLEDPSDAFMYYRFYLDVEPTKTGLQNSVAYIDHVGELLSQLWQNKFKAVAACDFEDKLPRQGGVNYQ